MHRMLTMLILLIAGISNASEVPIEASPCPGLVSSYGIERFELALVVTDADFASVEDCERLAGFYFDQPRAAGRSMDLARLSDIVDEIWQPVSEEAPFLLLNAVLSWLKDIGFDEHADALRSFFDEYMPEGEHIQLFFSIVIWFIVIATIILIVHELYRAGMLRLPRKHRRSRIGTLRADTHAWQWEDILELPPRKQVGALLQFSIECLAAAKLVPSSQSFTNHELVAFLQETDAHKAGLLREQIKLSEPVIYGDEFVTEQRVMRCRETSRELGDA